MSYNSIKNIFTLIKYTYIEIYKSKVLISTFLASLGIVLITYIASEFTYGVPKRVIIDLGLGCISFVSVIISVLMGSNLIAQEIENRTIYMILSRPISRVNFLIGKVLGLSGIIVTNIFVLSITTLSFYYLMDGEFSSLIFWSILYSIIEAIICLNLVVLFSLLTNQVLSVIFTFSLYIVGHSFESFKELMSLSNSFLIDLLLKMYNFFIPNFSKLNIKDFILYKNDISMDYLLGTFSYGILYIFFLLIISSTLFEKMNLD